MGVLTTADKKIIEVKNHLHQISIELSDILINECYGYDEFIDEYKELLWEVMTITKKFKDKL